MNEYLLTKLSDRFTVDELADALGITLPMFCEAFYEEIMENLDTLAEIDQGFVVSKEDYE